MPAPLISLGPFPLGEDRVHATNHAVFQVGGKIPPRLPLAENVDLDDTGWPALRSGITDVVAGTAIKNVVSAAGLLLLQDQGTIYKITPGAPYTAVALVTGLDSDLRVHFHEWAEDTVLWSNGETGGLITSAGAAQPWGLPVPATPTLGNSTGAIPAGTYRVVCTYEDAYGRESGATKAAEITLATAKAITVTLDPSPTGVAYINVYMAPAADQKALYWVKRVTANAIPITLTDSWTSTRQLATQFLRGPIYGSGIAEYKGYLLMWRDNVVFRSHGQTIHHFKPAELAQFDYDVQGVVGMNDGFFVATAGGMYWVTGNDPAQWQVSKLDSLRYLQGGSLIPAGLVKPDQTLGRLAVFACEYGLVIGGPDGSLSYPTQDRLQLDPDSRVEFARRQNGELSQLMMLVV